MNCNIIRNNNKNDLSATTTTNNIKNFPEKNFNRFKPRTPIQNMNVPYKAYKSYHKYKKGNKTPDEHLQTDNDISKSNHSSLNHDKLESFSFKFVNGDDNLEYSVFSKNSNFPAEKMFEINKRKFNVSSSYSPKLENFTVEFDSDLKSNASIVEHAKVIAKDIMNNPLSMENKLKKSNQEEYSHVIKSDKRKSNYKWINKQHNEPKSIKSFDKCNSNSVNTDRNHMKIKLNFLQESQLTSEQLADTCNNNKSLPVSVDCVTNILLQKQQQINGLNPSALEFTPSVDKKVVENVDKYSKEALENNFKTLNVNGDTGQPISNPVVLDDGLINLPFNFSFYDPHYTSGKMTASNDSTMVQNMYPYPSMPVARPISRMNYTPTQTIVPQFQVALYGNNPQLIRYNQSQNLPVNYLVYSPVMINGMYNPLLSNRIFPIGSTDIPPGNLTTQFAHPFNHNTNNNNNHIISVSSSQPYFTDSMSNNSNNSHIR